MGKSSRLSGAALILANGALLLCALIGLLLSFLSLYPVRLDPIALLPQTVIFALASLAAWSLPRYSGRVCLGLSALWALNVFLNWDKARRGAMLVFSVCLKFVSERLGYVPLFQYEPPAGISGAELAAVFLTLTLALLALLLGAAVVRLKSWLAVVLLTLPPLLPALIADAYPHWAGFLALAACWCAMLLTALCRGSERLGWLTLAALAACAALMAGIALLFPAEGYARPRWALDAEKAIVDFGDRWMEFLREWDGPFHDAGTPPAAARVELNGEGPRVYTGRTVLRARASAGGHYYLRGASLDVYTGSSWEPFPDEVWEEYVSALPEDAWTGSPLLFLGYASPFPTYSATVRNIDPDSGDAFLPYQPVRQDWEELGAWPVRDRYFQPAEGAWSFNVTLTPYDRDLSALLSWPDTHDGALSPLTGSVARAEEVYRDYVYEHYLDVPGSAREAVDGLLAQAAHGGAGPASVADAAELIPQLLAERCAYDLNTPAAPEGADYVTWFLNDSRQGYCMHFASAGVLMFRALGFPARYVSGYTAELEANRFTDVPDSAAHAWVEVYVNGWGWYPVEVTPGFTDGFSLDQVIGDDPAQEGDDPASPEETEPPAPTTTPEPLPTPSAPPVPTPEVQDPSGGERSPLPALAAGALRLLAVLALTAAVLWLFQFALKRRRLRLLSGPDTNRAALFGYRCLSRLRRWGGDVPPEARALAEKAMYSAHTLTEAERGAMTALLDGQRHALWMRLYGWRRLTFLYLWGGPKTREK